MTADTTSNLSFTRNVLALMAGRQPQTDNQLQTLQMFLSSFKSAALITYHDCKDSLQVAFQCIAQHITTLHDCNAILYLYDPGVLPGSANQCILGNVNQGKWYKLPGSLQHLHHARNDKFKPQATYQFAASSEHKCDGHTPRVLSRLEPGFHPHE